MDLLQSKVKTIKKYDKVWSIPRDVFLGKPINKKQLQSLKIGLFVNSCFGFGDVIFTIKMYNYFVKWYGVSPIIFTTTPELFLKNGFKPKMLKRMVVPGDESRTCEYTYAQYIAYNVKFGHKERYKPKRPFDCMFVTPWVGEYPDYNAIKGVFPESNRFNTFICSAYNRKGEYDFKMGLGEGNLGLLYSEHKECGKRIIENPYILVHISDVEEVDAFQCYSNFVKVVVKKYSKKHDRLDIIAPRFTVDDPRIVKLMEYLSKTYNYKVEISRGGQDDSRIKKLKDQRVLTLRGNVPVLPYIKYQDLICNALPDVLMTGNQSVADIITCCPTFNIYYQIMPWETNFAKQLAIYTKVDNLRIPSRSCGVESIVYKTRPLKKLRKESFEIKGKKYVDAVLSSVFAIKTDPEFIKFVDLALRSRKKDTLLKRLRKN